MAGSVNRVILVGRLGQDPETKYTQNNQPVVNVSLATSESWNDKNTGQKQDRTEWHRLVFFNKLAEIAGQYLKKGSQVYVEGSLRTRKWQGQDGRDNYTTEIVVSDMHMLGSANEGNRGQNQAGHGHQQDPHGRQQQAPSQRNQQPAQRQQGGGFCDDAGDIPF